MARILYSLCGVGMGHAIRSKVIIDHLKKKHKVMILASHDVYNYMKGYYKEVYNIEGLEFVFKNNSIATIRTLLRNLNKVNPNTVDNLELAKRKIDSFDPELVISDWETFSMYIAKLKKIPLLIIDNEHYISHGDYKYPKKYFIEWLETRIVARAITRRGSLYLVTLFPGTKLKKTSKAKAIPPILRPEIAKAKTRKGDYILVYQSTTTYKKLLHMLKKVDHKFIIYGFNINKKDRNLEFKKFDDKQGFVKDLAGCKAVICNGGFTLISEALYLQKPILTVPIKKHFEQILNALYVKDNRYGEMYEDLSEKNIEQFITSVEKGKYRKTEKWDNKAIFREVDQIVKEALHK